MKRTAKQGNSAAQGRIVQNKKAKFDYFVLESFEAGLVLQGWELKSIRAGKIQLSDTYVLFRKEQALLLGAVMTPLLTCSTHIQPDPDRTRILLLHKKQIQRLTGQVQQKGHSVVPLSLYWNKGRVKCTLALVKGKHSYDKRKAIKDREWDIRRQRILRASG